MTGNGLKRRRLTMGYTQALLAEKLGVTDTSIKNWERFGDNDISKSPKTALLEWALLCINSDIQPAPADSVIIKNIVVKHFGTIKAFAEWCGVGEKYAQGVCRGDIIPCLAFRYGITGISFFYDNRKR